MALHETHREDLFAEATALVQRIELRVPGESDPLVAGCRANGAWSLYFGPDPCYHFDGHGRLRRAFVDERLYRTQGSTLAQLTRERHAGQVELARIDLSAADCRAFLDRLRERLETLEQALLTGTAVRVRCLPEDGNVEADLTAVIHRIITAGPALAPPIPTRSH